MASPTDAAPSPSAPRSWAVAPFEHYMLCDDSTRYSMSNLVRVWIDGPLERATLEAALEATLPRHPLFQVSLRGDPRGATRHLRWEHPGKTRLPFIGWQTSRATRALPPGGLPCDLVRDIGLRLWVTWDEEKRTSLLDVQYHHAVCDGLGTFELVEDLLTAYGAVARGEAPVFRRTPDERLLPQRSLLGLSRADLARRLPWDLGRIARFFGMWPQPIALPRPRATKPGSGDIFAAVRELLPEAELTALKRVAKVAGATLNDVLLRDLFLALASWNERHAKTKRRRHRLRIAMPMSLRRAEDVAMSAVNRVSMVFLDRRLRAQAPPAPLLAGITSETRQLKERYLGAAMVRLMGWLGGLGVTSRFLALPVCQTTVVLTNLGKPFEHATLPRERHLLRLTGDLVVREVDSVAPVRDQTRLAVAVNTYGERLSITAHYDARTLSASEARTFLASYCERLRATATQPLALAADAPASERSVHAASPHRTT